MNRQDIKVAFFEFLIDVWVYHELSKHRIHTSADPTVEDVLKPHTFDQKDIEKYRSNEWLPTRNAFSLVSRGTKLAKLAVSGLVMFNITSSAYYNISNRTDSPFVEIYNRIDQSIQDIDQTGVNSTDRFLKFLNIKIVKDIIKDIEPTLNEKQEVTMAELDKITVSNFELNESTLAKYSLFNQTRFNIEQSELLLYLSAKDRRENYSNILKYCLELLKQQDESTDNTSILQKLNLTLIRTDTLYPELENIFFLYKSSKNTIQKVLDKFEEDIKSSTSVYQSKNKKLIRAVLNEFYLESRLIWLLDKYANLSYERAARIINNQKIKVRELYTHIQKSIPNFGKTINTNDMEKQILTISVKWFRDEYLKMNKVLPKWSILSYMSELFITYMSHIGLSEEKIDMLKTIHASSLILVLKNNSPEMCILFASTLEMFVYFIIYYVSSNAPNLLQLNRLIDNSFVTRNITAVFIFEEILSRTTIYKEFLNDPSDYRLLRSILSMASTMSYRYNKHFSSDTPVPEFLKYSINGHVFSIDMQRNDEEKFNFIVETFVEMVNEFSMTYKAKSNIAILMQRTFVLNENVNVFENLIAIIEHIYMSNVKNEHGKVNDIDMEGITSYKLNTDNSGLTKNAIMELNTTYPPLSSNEIDQMKRFLEPMDKLDMPKQPEEYISILVKFMRLFHMIELNKSIEARNKRN